MDKSTQSQDTTPCGVNAIHLTIDCLRECPPSCFFYDHADFVKACREFRMHPPDWLNGLIDSHESWLDHDSPQDSKRTSMPLMYHMHNLPWLAEITGNGKYMDAAILDFMPFHDSFTSMLTPVPDRRLLRGPHSGLLLQNLCACYATLNLDTIDTAFAEALAFVIVNYASVIHRFTERLYFSNVVFFKLAGVFNATLAIPAWKESRQVRDSTILELFECVRRQFRADGGHIEQSPHYSHEVLRDLAKVLVLCRKAGITIPGDIYETYRKAGRNVYMFQDGTGHFLDPGDARSDGDIDGMTAWWNTGLLEQDKVALNAPDRPDWAFLGLGGQHRPANGRGRSITLRSELMKESGYCFLRPTRNPVGTVMLFDCGPHGHFHGHYDLLSLILIADGETLIPDPGFNSYNGSSQRMAAMATAFHSTINIDMQNHAAREDDETPISAITLWNVNADGTVQVTGQHDGYAHLTGAPRLFRHIWYDGHRTWLILDRFISTSESRRQRPYACVTTFNLPDNNSHRLSPNMDRLETTLPNTANMMLRIVNPETIEHISLIPGRRWVKQTQPTSRLCLVTNGYDAVHLTAIQAHTGKPPPLTIESPALNPKDRIDVRLRVGDKKHEVSFA